ncbi:hypothetical protein ABK040_006944 [Willaertia magna]
MEIHVFDIDDELNKTPRTIPFNQPIKLIDYGAYFFIIITMNNEIFCFNNNFLFQISQVNTTNNKFIMNNNIQYLNCSRDKFFIINNLNEIYMKKIDQTNEKLTVYVSGGNNATSLVHKYFGLKIKQKRTSILSKFVNLFENVSLKCFDQVTTTDLTFKNCKIFPLEVAVVVISGDYKVYNLDEENEMGMNCLESLRRNQLVDVNILL